MQVVHRHTCVQPPPPIQNDDDENGDNFLSEEEDQVEGNSSPLQGQLGRLMHASV